MNTPLRSSRERPDLLDDGSPEGVRVVQLADEPDRWFKHIYMETPSVTPDGRLVIVSGCDASPRAADPEGVDLPHHFFLCDLADERGVSVRRLTDHGGHELAPSVDPTGEYLYYMVSLAQDGPGRVSIHRVRLDNGRDEELLVLDGPLSGGLSPQKLYPLGTMSPDGERFATACCFGTPGTGAPWGLLVADLPSMAAHAALLGPDFHNIHPQYCRSMAAPRDVMVQHNHADPPDADTLPRFGADIHLVRDDGTQWRGFPWGRDSREYCSGHQAWRGEQLSAVTSTGRLDTKEVCQELVESFAVPQPDGGDHRGLRQDGMRNLLSRSVRWPRFSHFGFDRTGDRIVSDCRPDDETGVDEIVFATIPPGDGRALRATHLLRTRNKWRSEGHAHPHPFLSPAGDLAFFNSNDGGWRMGAFMVTGLPETVD